MIPVEMIALMATATLPGPKAPPGNPQISPLIAGKYYISWTSGDNSAFTRIYRVGVGLEHTTNPGVTQWSTTIDATWLVAHYRNGQESAQIPVEES